MPEIEISSEYDNENENLKADIKRLSTELAATKEKLARAEKIIGFTDGLLKVGPFMPASHSKTHLIKMIKAYREVESE